MEVSPLQPDRPKIIHIPSPPTRAKLLLPPDEIRYELPFDPAFPNLVYVDRLHNEKWFTPMQVHDYFEICYIAEGDGWFILDGVKHGVQQGDLFVTKPHEVHCGGASGEGAYTLYSLGFNFEQWNELESDYYLLGPDRIVRDFTGNVTIWFDKLMNECDSEALHSAVMAKAYWTALLTDILRSYAGNGNKQGHSSQAIPPFIKSVLTAMHLSAHKTAHVPELAKSSGVSRSHLDREFKRLLGITPGDYARHLQLERAKQALKQTDQTVTEISASLGFDSVQSFCMFFKRHSGFSPQQYRKLSSNRAPVNNEQKR
jgi:AraC family L-rhamnose operon regulatory protein RhaS